MNECAVPKPRLPFTYLLCTTTYTIIHVDHLYTRQPVVATANEMSGGSFGVCVVLQRTDRSRTKERRRQRWRHHRVDMLINETSTQTSDADTLSFTPMIATDARTDGRTEWRTNEHGHTHPTDTRTRTKKTHASNRQDGKARPCVKCTHTTQTCQHCRPRTTTLARHRCCRCCCRRECMNEW